MKRPIIAGLLLLCAGVAAKADHMEYNWHDMIRPGGHKRGDAAFQADLTTCIDKVGGKDDPTPAFKRCMRELGYRYMYARTIRMPESEDGQPVCSARILRMEETAWTLNDNPLMRITFRITARGSRPFETTVSKPVSWRNPPRIGKSFRVYCDPANPGEVDLAN